MKPTRTEIQKAEHAIHALLGREYPDSNDDTMDGAFHYGMVDGFTLALRGLLDQAFPGRAKR